MANVKHFGIEAWADFARDAAPADQAQAMQSHLDKGCTRCSRIAGVWKLVFKIAQAEGRFSPPESLVGAVKALAALYLPKPSVRLLFDSFREPLPALIRVSATSSRRLIYQAGSVLLDLEAQREADGRRIAIVGQLLSKSRQKEGWGDVTIQVTSGDRSIAETTTNTFGEFHVEFESEGEEALRLRALVAHGKAIEIPLRLMRT